MEQLELKAKECMTNPKEGMASEIYVPKGMIDKEKPPKQVKLAGQVYDVQMIDSVKHLHRINDGRRVTGDSDRLIVSHKNHMKEDAKSDKKGSDKKDSQPTK